ncbi:MAG TPA: glycoside hydrolase family 3 C-terminal domain-containing protein [Polyangia bacterium]|nr:glycoside hydrolase family 3 C-terminal domain-containing protein [Polyangia bacterium]
MILRRMWPIVFAGAAVLAVAVVLDLGVLLTKAAAHPPKPRPTAAEVEKRADALLARMTLEEKLDYLGGADNFYIRAIKRLGLPAFRMADGPFGVRNVGPSTAYPAGIGLAASWDVALASRVGAAIGRDARARGVAIMLAPGVNIYRAPMCGRNFEYLGEDPFLAARMAVGYVEGMQAEGVSATIKHFLGNNSEVDRHHTSSDLDERTMREIYLPAFEAAVKEAHVGALMTSYNLVNGVHMTENAALVDGLVKKEWGFDGVVMSDWDATYDGVAAANAGLDIEMPSAKFMNRETLLPALKAGKVSQATIDDKVRRILRTAIRFGWLDRPAVDASLSLYSEEGRAVALDAARAGLVLLKNDGDLLPLDKKKLKTVALIGPNAYPAIPVGGGSAQVRPLAATSFVQGLADALRGSATVLVHHGVPTLAEIFDATDFVTAAPSDGRPGQPGLKGEYFDDPALGGAPVLTRVDPHVNFAWDKPNFWPTGDRKQSSARWTGAFIAPSSGEYRFAAFSYGLDEYRLYVDGKLILDRARGPEPINFASLALQAGRAYAIRFEYLHGDHHARVGLGVRRADAFVDPGAKELAARADVVVVAAGFEPMTESEGYDRSFQLPAGQEELIAAVRAANKRVIVAVTSGGGVDMTRFIDQVPAVLETWYAGQEGGTALAEVLLGEVNPSGKLPVTFERRFEDSAVAGSYYPDADKRIVYKEGVFLGYRHFDKTGQKPLFPFGHGLSYTRFKYGALAVAPEAMAADAPVTVSFDVTNIGKRRGAEIAQLYVGDRHAPVPRPPKELKGFAKIELAPGETKRVQLLLDRRALSYFDVATKKWRAEPGAFELLVGSSSQRIELTGKLVLK